MAFDRSRVRVDVIAADRVQTVCPLTWSDAVAVRTVPAGFVSDGASIPRAFWTLIGHPFNGQFLRAALVHDYDCVTRDRSQPEVVARFDRMLAHSAVGRVRRWMLVNAVKLFGPRWAAPFPLDQE